MAESYGIEGLEFSPDDIILDVGANSDSDLFSKPWYPSIYLLFEPDPRALESLKANADERWAECVEVVPHPLGETEGPITLYVSALGGDSSLSSSYEDEVVVVSL